MGTICVYTLQVRGGSKTEDASTCRSPPGGRGGQDLAPSKREILVSVSSCTFSKKPATFSAADSPLAGRLGSLPPPATFHGRFPARTADVGPRAEQRVPALATASLPGAPPRQGLVLARRGGRESGPSSDSKGWAPGQLGGAQPPI